ncbi:unnamed protein product, partial [Allacma fusca]
DGREYYQWLGIPYAKPPVGELRFASPKAVKPWDTVRVTSSYGSWCAQTTVYSSMSMFRRLMMTSPSFYLS